MFRKATFLEFFVYALKWKCKKSFSEHEFGGVIFLGE